MHAFTTLSPELSLPFMSNPIRTAVVPDEQWGGSLAWDRLSNCEQAGKTVAAEQSFRYSDKVMPDLLLSINARKVALKAACKHVQLRTSPVPCMASRRPLAVD